LSCGLCLTAPHPDKLVPGLRDQVRYTLDEGLCLVPVTDGFITHALWSLWNTSTR